MSSNVGLSTPRGSGTSGYVQRNMSYLKPRNAGYGAPYPPIASSMGNNNGTNDITSSSFSQRKPDQQILDHDRKRAIEVKVLEERERLEEENEQMLLEKERREASTGHIDLAPQGEHADKNKDRDGDKNGNDILSEEEIEERCNALRQRLLTALEKGERDGRRDRGDRRNGKNDDNRRFGGGSSGGSGDKWRNGNGGTDGRSFKERKQYKSYQVHELAEAKMEETERLRKALGIKEDWEKERGRKDADGGSGGRRAFDKRER